MGLILVWIAGCGSSNVSSRGAQSEPIEAAVPEATVESSSEASPAEAPAPAVFTAYCYLATRPSPPGHFSGCFLSETECLALLESRRRMFEEQGATLDVTCAVAEAPYCAVATDGVGQVTYRSCAIDLATCEEQRLRATAAITSGMASGAEPSCRPAAEEDVARRGARAPGLVGP